jgi:hypothetical protein
VRAHATTCEGRREDSDEQDEERYGEHACATRHRSIDACERVQRRFSTPHFGAHLPSAPRDPHHGRVVNFCAKVHRASVTRQMPSPG